MHALVVDDDPFVVALVQRALEQAGWTVHVARSFEEGRNLLNLRPDLLIADVRLGGFNGLYLAILARELNSKARILVISGYDDPVIRRDATEFGATFLAKPFTPSQLLDAIGHGTE